MIELLIMLLCLFINAFLSGIEMAFVSVGKPQLRELARKGNKEASRVLLLRDNPERTLSILQIGITLVGVLAAAVGGAGGKETFTPFLQGKLGMSESTAEILTVLGVALPYTYLSVVIGELVPKTIALRNPTQIILRSATWLIFLDRAFSPFVTLLEASTLKVLRILSFKGRTESHSVADEPIDLEALTQEHRQYMLNLFNIRRKTVRDIMLLWEQVVALDWKLPIADIAALVHSSGHTRLPIYDNLEVIGILHTKEFMALQSAGTQEWESIIRPVVQVQANDSLIRALRIMQDTRSHLSIVYSGRQRVGIVTMEDVFEEVIGEIYDEDDDGRLRRLLIARRRERLPQWIRRDSPHLTSSRPVSPKNIHSEPKKEQ